MTTLTTAAAAGFRSAAPPDCANRPDTLCRGVWQLTHQGWLARASDEVTAHAARIILIVVVAVITRFLLHRTISRLTRMTTQTSVPVVLQPLKERAAARLTQSGLVSARRQQRAQTISSVLRSVSSFVVFVVAFILVLGELGINLNPILASAGVAGVAVGFGAQNLVKDFLSGMFMILEDQYGVGDSIDVGQASGTVEAVGLRTTQLRDADGTIWYVRNGAVLRVGNLSQGNSQLVLDVTIASSADVDRAGQVILETAQALRQEEQWRPEFLSEPRLLGIQSLGPTSVVLRLTAKTRTGSQDTVASELRARLKIRLDAEDITLA